MDRINEYVIPQEVSHHQPAHLMYFSSDALCLIVLIHMLASTFIHSTYFLRLDSICV